jgi:hypothetical protein
MKRAILIVSLFIAATAFAAENDDQTRARATALDLAGAFSNDGFKMRDGHWSGTVNPHERTIVAVNLYAGNQYWFSAASTDDAKKVNVEVFDENGRQLPADNYSAGAAAAAGLSPSNSGQYFISLSVDGAAATCCLLYSYK